MDLAALEQTHQLMLASIDDRKISLKMSRLTVVQGRPRLRDRVTSELKTDEKKTQMDVKLETWDSYTGYCWKHQFPPTLSEKIRSKLYFLASQTRWDWAKYVEVILPTGGPLSSRVSAFPVGQPDLQVIYRVIERLSMDGSPPFPKMTEFRAECFSSFPVTHTQRMTLSQVVCSVRRISSTTNAISARTAPAMMSRACITMISTVSNMRAPADPAALRRGVPAPHALARGLALLGGRHLGPDHQGRRVLRRQARVRARGRHALHHPVMTLGGAD